MRRRASTRETKWKSCDRWVGDSMNDTNLVLGGKEFSSRLIVGTGKYSSMDVMKQAHEASGAQIITVALRRVSLPSGGSILDHLDTTRYTLLPNTAGGYTPAQAIRPPHPPRRGGPAGGGQPVGPRRGGAPPPPPR